ncbi:UNVERIFIED_CONTAM: CRISPR-associated protein Cas1 [Acetivibrio alkalicellulosi]
MTTVYIKEQGAYIHKSGNHITITLEGQKLCELPLADITTVVLLGNVQLSTQSAALLMRRGIDIHYLSSNYTYRGSLLSPNSPNIFVKLAHFNRYRDFKFREIMARNFIRGKVNNQISHLRKSLWGKQNTFCSQMIEKMLQQVERLDEISGVDSLMGIEGVCAFYFKCIPYLLKNTYDFKGRERKAKDPLNSLLNLGYAFIGNELYSIIITKSLEPMLGFLHGVKHGRRSLVFDLMEEFRQPVIDRFSIMLLNKGIIKESDFVKNQFLMKLDEECFKTYCYQYEKYMEKPRAPNNKNFRELMKNQVENLRKTILEGVPYECYKFY